MMELAMRLTGCRRRARAAAGAAAGSAACFGASGVAPAMKIALKRGAFPLAIAAQASTPAGVRIELQLRPVVSLRFTTGYKLRSLRLLDRLCKLVATEAWGRVQSQI